jgi:hypothetical protein
MKKIFVYTMLLGLLKLLSGCTGTAFYPYGYSVHGNKVFYKFPFPQGATEIEEADAATFQLMGESSDSEVDDSRYYGRDKNSVFYYGHIIPGSDGPSLKLLGTYFAKDKGQCYYNGTALPEADPATFVVKDRDFSADKGHIYRRDYIMDTDPSIFETFDSSSVVRTANTVSVYDYVVKLPKDASFKFIGFNYFAINGQVYRWEKMLTDAEMTNFTVLTDWISKTTEHVYYDDKIIEHADPQTFRLLASPYSRDAKHVFFFERIVENADPATFEVINDKFQCARDKHAMFHEDKMITNYSDSDFVNRNECTSCNETRIYFAEKQ